MSSNLLFRSSHRKVYSWLWLFRDYPTRKHGPHYVLEYGPNIPDISFLWEGMSEWRDGRKRSITHHPNVVFLKPNLPSIPYAIILIEATVIYLSSRHQELLFRVSHITLNLYRIYYQVNSLWFLTWFLSCHLLFLTGINISSFFLTFQAYQNMKPHLHTCILQISWLNYLLFPDNPLIFFPPIFRFMKFLECPSLRSVYQMGETDKGN